MRPINVLSLFDGISCGRLALQRAGISVDHYFASEIDKYAIQVTQKNFPDTIQIGDVTKIDWKPFKGKIDLLIGGSPCQDLSIAKTNREGLQGKRSGLFFNYLDALLTAEPKYFLLENVASMPKEAKDLISRALGVEPIMINSALVSAQQRKRLYWTNIPNVTQPEDKGIFLQDILEDGLPIRGDKSRCVTSSIARTTQREYFKKNQGCLKAYCVDANYWKSSSLQHCLEKHVREQVAVPVALRNRGQGKQPEFNGTEKANSLTTVQTDSMVCQPIRIGNLPNLGKGQANRIYSVKGKSICLNANGGGSGAKTGLYKVDLPDGDYVIRKLTPTECERLQTLPDGYTKGVSDTQRYKCIGNGWTVDVIAHILKGLK